MSLDRVLAYMNTAEIKTRQIAVSLDGPPIIGSPAVSPHPAAGAAGCRTRGWPAAVIRPKELLCAVSVSSRSFSF